MYNYGSQAKSGLVVEELQKDSQEAQQGEKVFCHDNHHEYSVHPHQ